MSADLFSKELRYDMSKLAMWLFLATELLLFTGLFATYFVFRYKYAGEFRMASEQLDVTLGAINTVALLISSLFVALSVETIKRDKIKETVLLLLATLFCGLVFCIIKYFEYGSKIHHGLFPSQLAHDSMSLSNGEILFFVQYFIMTGIHALHVVIGMGIWVYILVKMYKKTVSASYFAHLEVAGLYWHLVDLIWIFVFPMLYLAA